MNRVLFILGLIMIPFFGSAQGDMLLLKKKGKVFRSYYQGSTIYYDIGLGMQKAQIFKLERDSVFLAQYQVRKVMGLLGAPVSDTVGTYRYGIHYEDIVRLAEMHHGWDWQTSGAALLGGGTLLTVGGLLTWVFAEKNSRYYARPELVVTAAALAGIGYLLTKTKSGKGYRIGGKYALQYISTK